MSDIKVDVTGLSKAFESAGISAIELTRTLSSKDWKFTRLPDDTGVYKEWSSTPIEASWPAAAGPITYTYEGGLETKIVPAPTLQSVPTIDPEKWLENYLLIRLDSVHITGPNSKTAWGTVEKPPHSWSYQFIAHSAGIWFCEELGGSLIRLPDLSWAVLCYVE